MGFLSHSLPTVSLARFSEPKCGQCGLFKNCISPKMPVAGEGRRKVLVIGEAPGEIEDQQGKPFVGRTGQRLQQVLSDLGVDLFRDCWVTNSVICHPFKDKLPEKAVGYCQPNVLKAVRELDPEVIILLGAQPVKSLIGALWKEDPGGITRWAGFRIPCQIPNAWVCPTFHPSFVMREEMDGKGNPVAGIWWKEHLKQAFKLKGRPWDEVPDYSKQVEVVVDPEEAAGRVESFLGSCRGPFAFDIETTTLKPDGPHADIHSCSVSDGRTSVAFPWHGPVVRVMKEFLRSPIPKVGYNVKYESRWMHRKLGIWVKNWVWDGMVNAHIIDNRSWICGLKFQAFALLGQPSYDDAIRPYLRGKQPGSHSPNRIREVPLDAVLRYCGLDSLLEMLVARKQAKQLGVKL